MGSLAIWQTRETLILPEIKNPECEGMRYERYFLSGKAYFSSAKIQDASPYHRELNFVFSPGIETFLQGRKWGEEK